MQTPQIKLDLLEQKYHLQAQKANLKLAKLDSKKLFSFYKKVDKIINPFYFLNSKKSIPFFNSKLLNIEQDPLFFNNISVFVNKHNDGQIIKCCSGVIEPNKITVIFGESGSGKTTLIKQLGLFEKPSFGYINCANYCYFANQYQQKITKNFKQKIGYILQKAEDQFFCDSILEEVLTGAVNLKLCHKKDVNYAKKYLDLCGLENIPLIKNPIELSDGQKKRLALASVLAMQVKFLILDEPTVGLDQMAISNLSKMLVAMKQTTRIVIVSHDVDFIFETADKIIHLHQGKIIHQTTVNDFFSNTSWLMQYGITPPVIIQAVKMFNEKGIAFKNQAEIKNLDDLISELKNLFSCKKPVF
ncbi:ABC transporter ATP-binding protein [Mycoplasmoides genitalium]